MIERAEALPAPTFCPNLLPKPSGDPVILAGILFVLFTILAVAGLFSILWYHYGWKVATVWSVALLVAFVVLGWFVWSIIATGAGG